MLQPLTEAEKQYAFSQGMLEGWLEDAPAQMKEHLANLVSGISAYRERMVTLQEDYDRLLTQHNLLASTSAQYLQEITHLRSQTEQLLLEQQTPIHTEVKARNGIIDV